MRIRRWPTCRGPAVHTPLPGALCAALTHVELPHEAGHVVVLEVLGQHLLGKLTLVRHVEAVPTLQETWMSHVAMKGAGRRQSSPEGPPACCPQP